MAGKKKKAPGKRRKRQPQSLDMFSLGKPAEAIESAEVAQEVEQEAPRPRPSAAFRLSRPICLEVDLAGDEPSYAVVGEESGERVTALSRSEFLDLARLSDEHSYVVGEQAATQLLDCEAENE